MIALLDHWKIALAAILGAMVAYGPVYYLGKTAGRNEAAMSALENTVAVLKSRELTNAEITRSDAAVLCADFGLPDSERLECVRRLAEAGNQ